MSRFEITLALSLTSLVASAVTAQGPVEKIKDLNGARAGQAEMTLQQRGFEHVRTEKSDDSSYGYWRETATGSCVQILTTNGVYSKIRSVDANECVAEASTQPATGMEKDEFKSICGTEGREAKRMECKVVDTYEDGRKTKTLLYTADGNTALIWLSPKRVAVRVDGNELGRPGVSISNGKTTFEVDGTTHFYYSDKDAARHEVRNN